MAMAEVILSMKVESPTMKAVSRVFHTAVVIYSAVFLFLTMTTFAQSYVPRPRIAQSEVDDLDRRMNNIEALAIDRRLGVIESVLSDLKAKVEKGAMDYMSNGAIALMLGRTAFEMLRKEKKQGNSSNENNPV